MPIDREKLLRTADKLIRQNKFLAAVEQYSLLLKETPNDLVLINKIGDLHARAGRPQDAVRHFQRIGADYTRGGFFVKAIAIYKKILKLDPESTDSMQRLGDLYARQDLLKEAREMYTGAARRHLARGDSAKAIEIFDKLVKLEPGSPELRSEYAGLLEKSGNAAGARDERLVAARLLTQAGRAAEAGKIYRQALLGVSGNQAACAEILRAILQAEGGPAAASLCEQMYLENPDSSELLDLLVESFSACGRIAEAGKVSEAAVARGVSPGPVTGLALARHLAAAGNMHGATQAGVRAVDDLMGAGRSHEAGAALEEMLLLMPGCVPLLTRRLEMLRAAGHTGAAAEVMERLVREYRAAGLSSQADLMQQALESLKEDVPDAATPAREAAAESALPLRRDATRSKGQPESAPARRFASAGEKKTLPEGAASLEEAEFLTEYLAEADVFTRYGMVDKAIEQYETILLRVPGHAASRRRLKALLVETGRRARAVEECVALAELHAAASRREEAIGELKEALNLDAGNAAALALLSHLRAKPRKDQEPESIAISLEDELPSLAPPAAPVAAAVRAVPPVPVSAPERPLRASAPHPGAGMMDLTEGLEQSLADALDDGGALPVISPDQEVESLPEVIAAFQDAVRSQVDAEDYATHFELGIAYKEMGLLDEAIGEFEYACSSAPHKADSLRLLASCHRERGDHDQAERCYREALGAAETSEDADNRRMGLVFELGDLLALKGEWGGAKAAFAEVFQRDPHYLDVAERLQEASRQA